MNPTILFMGIFGLFMLENAILLLVWLINKRWDIPIVVLRFVGNRTRPLIIMRKGRKFVEAGVPKLRVKGYPLPIRDYRNENYYPAVGSKYGALILWEFEDGMLTPCVPSRMVDELDLETKKKLSSTLEQIRSTKWVGFQLQSPFWRRTINNLFDKIVAKRSRWGEKIILQQPKAEQVQKIQSDLDAFRDLQTIKFEFDDLLHKRLKLKAVDDVDIDWMIQQQTRIDNQYTGGWRDFLAKYAGHIAIILIAAMMLIAVIFVIIKLPELMQACGGQGVETAKNFIAEYAKSVGGGAAGTPPG